MPFAGMHSPFAIIESGLQIVKIAFFEKNAAFRVVLSKKRIYF
jgi:hypothetical protein